MSIVSLHKIRPFATLHGCSVLESEKSVMSLLKMVSLTRSVKVFTVEGEVV